MRVAVVADETARHVETDATLRLRDVTDRLAARGHEVVVVCSQWWEGDADSFDADGVEYHAYVDDAPGTFFETHVRLPQRIRAVDPDVIHAVESRPGLAAGAAIASRLSRVPLLLEWYDPAEDTGWGDLAEQVAVRAPDLVVTPSRLVRTRVRELGRDAAGIDVIPTGIDLDRIESLDADPVADIVYSRRLDRDANLESLLLALAELRDLAWDAVVIGDGPDRARYEEHAADLRLSDRVTFVGEQAVDRRLQIYKGARAYVQTARRAPFALELLRAIACGCVGIAEYHEASSAHELVEQYDRGMRTTTEDEMVASIRRAAEYEPLEFDPRLDEYDANTVLERYLDHYRRLQQEYGLL